MEITKPQGTEDLAFAIENAPAVIEETGADELSAVCVIADAGVAAADQVATLSVDGMQAAPERAAELGDKA